MLKIKKLAVLIFCVFIIVTAAGCTNNTDVSSTSSFVPREPYQAENVVSVNDFVDTDGDFKYDIVSWDGPKGYVIVAPQELNDSAKILKEYYVDASLKIQSSSTEDNKIVLKIDGELEEGEIKVYLDGKDLIFSAGHSVSLNSAVHKYIRTAPEYGKATIFELETDFSSTALDGYKYVWGDEFEGSDVDFTKWSFGLHMGGTTKIEVSYDKNVIDVNDGRLKLHALRFYNPERAETEYRVPYGVATQNKMHFLYGYAEIRARLPLFSGAWPSFWAKTDASLKVEGNPNSFLGEIDIFEVFGDNIVKPNLIKWYGDKTDAMAVSYIDVNEWPWEDSEKHATEYHTYGFEWTSKTITMSVDGEPYHTFDITKTYDKRETMSSFHEPIYLIFNNHLFATDSATSRPIIENNHNMLPYRYYIDYIRVYQKDGVGKLYIDSTDDSELYADRK